MRYYIADLHFFHEKLNQHMDKRGFEDVYQMNEYMIEQWNAKVRKNDEVVILGDFSWGKAEETKEVLDRLAGKKYFIMGNHDHFMQSKDFDPDQYFEWVLPYKELSDNRRKVILCHYPIMCYNYQYHLDDNGNPKTYMLHGHVHSTKDQVFVDTYQDFVSKQTSIRPDGVERPIPCQFINCFCVYSNYQPMTLDEWIEINEKRDKTILKML